MKILLLTPQLPYPPQQGASLRNYYIMRGLAERHQVTLLSFLETDQTTEPAVVEPLLKLCETIDTVPVPERSLGRRFWQLLASSRPDMAYRLCSPLFDLPLRQFLNRNAFDVVQVEGIELARYMTTIRQVSPGSKVVFDDHNAETELQRRAFLTDLANPRRWPAAAYSWFQTGRLQRFERWACRMADAVTAVSEADCRHLQALAANKTPVYVVPNCLDVNEYRSDQLLADEPQPVYDLVFSGKMDYRPNVDAVLWFADEIWPRIRQARPQTTWAIVGQKPHGRLARLRQLDGVTLTGRVARIQPYLAGAQLFLMPFRLGSGTRLKLIEAMAAGKAIVSTPAGAEGFPLQHNRELFLAQDPAEFAMAVLRLLNHPEERERLGTAARAFARQYDWRRIIPAFEEVYQQLIYR